METFIAAYVVVLLGMTLFVARLGIRQRRLERAIEALQAERLVQPVLHLKALPEDDVLVQTPGSAPGGPCFDAGNGKRGSVRRVA